jgi:hypothetical protein
MMCDSRFGIFAASAILIQLMGCVRELPYPEFAKNYEQEMAYVIEKQGFRFSLIFVSPEYELARSLGAGIGEKHDDQNAPTGIRVGLNIRLVNSMGGPEDAMRDPLFSSALEGDAAFSERMQLFQFGMGGYFHLEDSNGKRIPPLTYHFSRKTTANGVCSFLFLFPEKVDGEALVPEKLEAVLADFGLRTGTIRMKLRSKTDLKLKV